MATPSVLTFDAEGRAVDFEVWVDDLQLFLQCDRADGLSLFDLTSGASPAPPATADSTVRSQWATRDASARLAVRRHLPTTERAHFSQYRSAQTLYNAVVARYSSPATAALSRLFLPYLFPDLTAFPTVTDLITHLRTSDTRYRAALPAEFCAKKPPPMYLTLYYIVTRLPDSLCSDRDHFLSVCPTSLTVDLLEERLLAAEQSIVAVGASGGDPRTPVFQGCSPPPLLPSVASAAAADLGGFESVGAASAPSGRRRPGRGRGGRGADGTSGGGGGSGGGGSGGGGGDIPTPRSYAKAIEGPYSSQWQSAMDAEMASWKSTGTYVDEVPPPGANIVSGMWIFRVKRPPGSPPVFKARYVARGFSQRQGVDFFQTFSPTPKITTLQVLLHVAAQRDYELHSLDFSTAFLQGSLHEEIWLRRPPGFTGSFPPGTQWSLRRPVYGLRQAPREWHDTLRTTLAALGFSPSTADPSLFLRTYTSLPPFYILVYVDDLVFATVDTEGLAHITRDRARRTITLTQSHMVQQVLQRFNSTYSSPQATPLSTSHSLSALPSDESVEPSGPYPELVGCLMYLMTCTRPHLAYPLSILARYVAPGRHRPEHMAAAKRVLRYLCNTSGTGLVLGGRRPVVLTGHADASWADDQATQRSSQGYTFSLGSGSVSWRSTRSSSVLGSSCEAEIYAGAMAAQELRWLTYLLTDLGEQPRSPPVLYLDNKAMLALCREHRLEHRTKHIALRYFLARELQQRGQLRLAYVASEANTADIYTKALPPGDHQRFCTLLACFALLDWSCDLLFSPTLPMGPTTRRAAEPTTRRVDDPPSRRANDPPSRAAQQPSRRAAQQPSRRAARQPSRPAAELPNRPAAEPPSRPAIDPLLFLPARPDPTYSDW
ncbi:unnamed protein product [Closterium sp. NIES-53]